MAECCFSGFAIAALGRLQHSHYYYSQVVPRHGGRWESVPHEADYVVAPVNIADLAACNAALRTRLAEVLASPRRCRIVDESFLADSLAQRRSLLDSEVLQRAVHIPAALVKQWTDDIGKPLRKAPPQRASSAAAAAAAAAAEPTRCCTRDTQTEVAADAEAGEGGGSETEDTVTELHRLEDALHGIAVRTAAEGEGGAGREYYASQQGAYNGELRAKLETRLQEGEAQVAWLRSQVESARAGVAGSLKEGRAALVEYQAGYAAARPQVATKFSLAEEWGLRVPPQAAPLRAYPLEGYVRGLQAMRTARMSGPTLENMLAAMAPVWETYVRGDAVAEKAKARKAEGDDSSGKEGGGVLGGVLEEVASGHVLAFSDSMQELKDSFARPLEEALAACRARLREIGTERAAAQAERDYAGAVRLGLDAAGLLEEALKAVEGFQRGVSAGSADVLEADGALRAFRGGASGVAERVRERVARRDAVEADAKEVARREGDLRARLAALRAARRAAAERHEALLDENARASADLLARVEDLQAELEEVARRRRALCEAAEREAEELAGQAAWCEQRLRAVPELEGWTQEARGHCAAALEMLRATQDAYDDIGRMVEEKRGSQESLDALVLHGCEAHCEVLTEYCTVAGGVVAALDTRRAAMEVHRRAVELQLELADKGLDSGAAALEKLRHGLREDLGRVEHQREGLAGRLAAQVAAFDARSAPALEGAGRAYTHPSAHLRSMSCAAELSTRAAIASHLDKEKQAMAFVS